MNEYENEEKRVLPGPGEWHWLITADDVAAIKAGDRNAVDRVYFANLQKFGRIANSFVRKNRNIDFRYKDDIKQQIYIDLPTYDYTNVSTLYCGILRSCYAAIFFRNSIGAKSYDVPAYSHGRSGDGSDMNETVLDRFVPACDMSEFAVLRDESELRVLKVIAGQKKLTERQKDMLTALAFRVRIYPGIFAYEYARAFGGAAC